MGSSQAGLKSGEKGRGIQDVGLRRGAPACWETQVLTDSLASQQALRLSDHSFTICEMRRLACICDFPIFSFFKRNLTQEPDVENNLQYASPPEDRGQVGCSPTAAGHTVKAGALCGLEALGLRKGRPR